MDFLLVYLMLLNLSRPITPALTLRLYSDKLFYMSFKILKRGLDIIISLLALIILWPALLLIVIAIKVGSKGPAVFKQQRAGKNGNPFVFYKFRTMTTDTDPFGPSPKSGRDPRLTKVGRILREYSLDELPQLFNILKGDMSVVGPRPLYLSQIPEWSERQKKRLLVKPGLTGLAQISGRGELTREEKLELDVKYAETARLSADMRIILATFVYVFSRKNIYEKRYSQAEATRSKKP
ncbi:MAG: sugar transferase [Planctomycetota bacterium]|jgi:lipopolysaccharide/colanic/teichoic acid biosynthesis glycosyltransferase